MKRFFLIFITLILVVSIFLILMQSISPEISDAEVLQEAFNATGADIVSSEIYITGELGFDYNSEEKRSQLIESFITAAGSASTDEKPVFSHIDNDSIIGTETDLIINENINVHISLIKNKQDGSGENYRIAASLTDTSRQQDLPAALDEFSAAIKKYGIEPDINICITGSMEGNLEDSELEIICAKVFDITKANKVEGIRDNGLISVSAFSPEINDVVRVNGKRVNLNVAIRYNSYESKTYIWLATPIITTEY